MKAFAPIFLMAAAASAQTAYNGDFMGGDSNVTQADTLSDMWVFDQVNILSPHVTAIWGNFVIYQQYAGASLGLRYEIRSGVSSGHAGTLVASGTVSNLRQTPTGRSTQNTAYREVQLLGTVDLNLAPDIYWLGLQNNEGPNPPAQWTSFLTQTSGGDAGPAADPNPPPQNAILDHTAYLTGTEIGDWILSTRDYSLGVISVGACYANCDGSTLSPVLNVLDFSCFLNRFAAGDTYANCDGSTVPPVLNVLDFACFLNAFAAGCP